MRLKLSKMIIGMIVLAYLPVTGKETETKPQTKTVKVSWLVNNTDYPVEFEHVVKNQVIESKEVSPHKKKKGFELGYDSSVGKWHIVRASAYIPGKSGPREFIKNIGIYEPSGSTPELGLIATGNKIKMSLEKTGANSDFSRWTTE